MSIEEDYLEFYGENPSEGTPSIEEFEERLRVMDERHAAIEAFEINTQEDLEAFNLEFGFG